MQTAILLELFERSEPKRAAIDGSPTLAVLTVAVVVVAIAAKAFCAWIASSDHVEQGGSTDAIYGQRQQF